MARQSKPSRKPGGEARRKATRAAVAHATRTSAARDAAKAITVPDEPRGDRRLGGDPFTGELRKREVLPLLVLHFIHSGPSYGNQLMERISSVTEGVLSVNPNTMYPLLRQLEARGLIEGRWEHPERRSRRYYSLTSEGEEELERLVRDVRPFLESIARSIEEIVAEVYGGD
jgi:DNA-binding PadR family transcriptional regulator